ncbi:MAG TPA: hypothetical protein PK280_07845 [Planctomycetota bacterium]|nr:hypothetical protein [Planctomycetota bacterium]
MSRRRLLLAVAAGTIVAAALAAWLLLGPLSPSRRLAARVAAATGLPCSIESVRPADGALEVRGLALGAEPGPVVEIDRLCAEGDLGRRELRTVSMTRGQARLVLPEVGVVRLTDVDLSAGGLEALTSEAGGGEATVAVSGYCVELNPVLKEHGRVRFLRGRFTLSARLSRMRSGDMDVPVRIILTDFHVQALDRRFEGEAGSAEAVVRLTGSLREPRLDARELAPFLGGVDLSTRR